MLVATFGPSTLWEGKRITYEGGVFILEDYGRIAPRGVMQYDRQGHLIWAEEELREWVGTLAAEPAKRPTTASTEALASREALPTEEDPSREPIAEQATTGESHPRRRLLIPVGIALAVLVVLAIVVLNREPNPATSSVGQVAATSSPGPDTTAPVTEAFYTDGWQRGPAIVAFEATDDSSSSDQCSISSSTDGKKTWKMADKVVLRGEGEHTVWFYAVDPSGNEEKPRSITVAVKIDRDRPVTAALNSPSVQKGSTVALAYRIDDQTPRAEATLVLSGPKKKTIRLGSQRTNRQRVYKLTADLPVGTYRWTIRAKDLAGNSASQRSPGRLVVTPRPHVPQWTVALQLDGGSDPNETKSRVFTLAPGDVSVSWMAFPHEENHILTIALFPAGESTNSPNFRVLGVSNTGGAESGSRTLHLSQGGRFYVFVIAGNCEWVVSLEQKK
jgi:hypothetical protein